MRRSPSTTAAAVSSQLVSMPRILIRPIYNPARVCAPYCGGLAPGAPYTQGAVDCGADGNERRRLAFREPQRSAEPTSELQSLMRISFAVFSLKKKNT